MSNPNKTHDNVGTAYQMFKSAIFGEIRAVTRDDIWFVAADVFRGLGISDPKEFLPKFKASQVDITYFVNTAGEPQVAILVSESGLHDYIKENVNPNTTAFWGWVSGIVVPTMKENNLRIGGKMSKVTQKQNVKAGTQTEITTFLQVFQNEELGELRMGVHEGKPYIVGIDLCKMLDLSNTSKALSRVPDDDRDEVTLSDPIGRKQKTTILYEPGFYRMIFTSNKPDAEKIKKWVFNEVLPSINKNGGYMLPQGQQDLKYDSTLGDRIIELGELINKREQAQQERYDIMVGRANFEETVADHYRQIADDQQKLLDKKTIRLGDVEKYIRMKMGSVVQPEYLGTNEVARRLNVSRRTVQRLMTDSEQPLPVVRLKGCVRVKTTELEKYIKKYIK